MRQHIPLIVKIGDNQEDSLTDEEIATRKVPGRLAPYPVWLIVRIISTAGFVCLSLFFPFLVAKSWWGLYLFVTGFIIVGPTFGRAISAPLRRKNAAILPELIGSFFASPFCPSCAQGIFDRTPQTGYIADSSRGTWWPQRICEKCGHDFMHRTAD